MATYIWQYELIGLGWISLDLLGFDLVFSVDSPRNDVLLLE